MVYSLERYNFDIVLNQLTRSFWSDLDFHRFYMQDSFEKIKNISRIRVNRDVYHSLNPLETARYSHFSEEDKCFPNKDSCYRCFKYFCPICNKGTNSMFAHCCGKRCLKFLKSRDELFINSDNFISIYVFEDKNPDISFRFT